MMSQGHRGVATRPVYAKPFDTQSRDPIVCVCVGVPALPCPDEELDGDGKGEVTAQGFRAKRNHSFSNKSDLSHPCSHTLYGFPHLQETVPLLSLEFKVLTSQSLASEITPSPNSAFHQNKLRVIP